MSFFVCLFCLNYDVSFKLHQRCEAKVISWAHEKDTVIVCVQFADVPVLWKWTVGGFCGHL